jgi:ubiquinone/menaquinone biosynthesis C-methylase UbiE
MVAIAGFNKDQIFAAVRQMYSDVATSPARQYHFPTGRDACRFVGYPDDMLVAVPTTAHESFAGVGFPFRADVVRTGETVLDVGAGSGTDTLIAANLVGPRGHVYALDITAAMIAKLRRNISEAGVANVEVIEGNAEAIPLPDASVDVVTSNGVLNLVPDKPKAIAEILRVLRPGGRVQIADIVVSRPVGKNALRDPSLWAECVVGASIEEDYLDLFRMLGFVDVKVLRRYDYFSGSASADTRRIAAALGGRAVEITMRRADGERSRVAANLVRWSPFSLGRRASQHGLVGLLATGGALVACYGLLALVAVLGVMGLSMPLNEDAWAAAIVGLAVLAPVGLALNLRVHRCIWPIGIGVAGTLVVSYATLAHHDWRTEATGFAALIGAVAWDRQLFRTSIGC